MRASEAHIWAFVPWSSELLVCALTYMCFLHKSMGKYSFQSAMRNFFLALSWLVRNYEIFSMWTFNNAVFLPPFLDTYDKFKHLCNAFLQYAKCRKTGNSLWNWGRKVLLSFDGKHFMKGFNLQMWLCRIKSQILVFQEANVLCNVIW